MVRLQRCPRIALITKGERDGSQLGLRSSRIGDYGRANGDSVGGLYAQFKDQSGGRAMESLGFVLLAGLLGFVALFLASRGMGGDR